MGPKREPVVSRRHAEVVGEFPERVSGLEAQAILGCARVQHSAGKRVGTVVVHQGHRWKVRARNAGSPVVHPRQRHLIGEAGAEGGGPGEPRGIDRLRVLAAARGEAIEAHISFTDLAAIVAAPPNELSVYATRAVGPLQPPARQRRGPKGRTENSSLSLRC